MQRILTENLNMHKISARWLRRLLSQENKDKRVAESRKFLERYRKHGEELLLRIITIDETWLFLYGPETKEQSRQCKSDNSPPPQKARVVKSAGKQMYIYFIDIHGMILGHAVPPHETVNAEYYSKVITDVSFFSKNKF